MKTKVTEFLEQNNISYRLLNHNKEVYTCEEAAKERNVPLDEMIKCILLKSKDDKHFLACLLADKQLDPNKVRIILNSKRLSFASEDEIKRLGYELGAVPPLLIKIPIVFDEEIKNKEKVNISSGNPIAGIELKAKDLIKLVNPIIGDIKK